MSDISDKIAKVAVEGIAHKAAEKITRSAEKSAERYFDNQGRLAGKRLSDHLDKTIPSFVNKVKNKELTPEDASRQFNKALQGIDDRGKVHELQNKFNRELRDIDHPSSSTKTNQKPRIVIDGPFSIYPDQSIYLTANTEGYDQMEDYDWQVHGKINGVNHTPGADLRSYEIVAESDSQKGTLYITARGLKSRAEGAFTVRAIGKRTTKTDQDESDSNDDEDEAKKKRPLYQRFFLGISKK